MHYLHSEGYLNKLEIKGHVHGNSGSQAQITIGLAFFSLNTICVYLSDLFIFSRGGGGIKF